MLAAPSGPVLTPRVLDRMEELKETNVFFALQPGQVDLELLEELRFTWGFQVCRVGRPTQDYLRRFLLQSAGDLLITIDPLTDLDQVIAHTRRLRGGAFCEKDLESLLHWAVQRRAPLPLTGKDLMFRPYQPKREAWDRLKAMTGLDEVKDALRRILATAILENHRRQSGALPQPFCRNLAFSGPPGTGKSVAARLTAQILREEGCGTGRFIEAGREQLIGTYLGETSPKIAELFKKARGGVLFIDEAGALLDGGNDIYAAEAVNALVRHMELDPETIVILATYPREMAQLLASNPGLFSRIAQVLDFPPYTVEDLWQILQSFAAQAPTPCTLPPEARQISTAFFSTLRRRTGPRFGNAREARRLFQASIQELALRLLDTPSAPDNTLTRQDLKNAAHRLLTQPANESRSVGFRA
ncbi:MAG: AAA family ATPase [Oscillibacter sp.]|nr:AAA family ATPase [Oscillibacter sp.]